MLQGLPFDAPLGDYESQAERLLEARRATDAADLDLAGARLAVARHHDFADWPALVEWVEAVHRGAGVFRFEAAVEAVIGGDLETLERWLGDDPELVRARSTRRTPFDPPVHRATLLHYVAANGVEQERQRTPRNAPDVARALLAAGADADALASLYGGECTTMSLLVSSVHPARAGVQGELIEILLDHGAAIEGHGEKWGTPLMTALGFGYLEAAEVLARRGARADGIAAAAGLGRTDEVARLLPHADARDRHLALALAARLGHVEVVRGLLDAGEDPNRYNPREAHAHSTPLHQAVHAGHAEVVELLVERGARLDVEDRIYSGTPLGWAEHAGREGIARYLRGRGAR